MWCVRIELLARYRKALSVMQPETRVNVAKLKLQMRAPLKYVQRELSGDNEDKE